MAFKQPNVRIASYSYSSAGEIAPSLSLGLVPAAPALSELTIPKLLDAASPK